MAATVVSLDVLVIAPRRFRFGTVVREALPEERARTTDMALRLGGTLAALTRGRVRFRAQLVDPDRVFDVWARDDVARHRYAPTTEGGRFAPAIHAGAAQAFCESLAIPSDAYPLRFFLAPDSILPSAHADLTWANWSYCSVRASPGWASTSHKDDFDVLGHAALHQLQWHIERLGEAAGFLAVDPDKAREYGFPDPNARGWTDFLMAALSGEVRRIGFAGTQGMTSARWRKVFPADVVVPVPAVARRLPDVAIDFDADWTTKALPADLFASAVTPVPVVPAPVVTPAAAPADVGARVAALAETLVGRRYVWGTHGPDTFDCSGLTSYVWKVAGGVTILPGSEAQRSVGEPVALGALRPGDILLFDTNEDGDIAEATHAGLYTGPNRMVNALNETRGVVVSEPFSPYFTARFLGARRPVPARDEGVAGATPPVTPPRPTAPVVTAPVVPRRPRGEPQVTTPVEPGPSEPVPATPGGHPIRWTSVVTGQPLNLRTEPSKVARLIETMPVGTRLARRGPTVSSDDLVWYEVDVEGGARGWCVGGFKGLRS